MRRYALILALALAFPASAEKELDMATAWTDANRGGAVDAVVIITPVDEDTTHYEYAFVPHRTDMRAVFCIRRGTARGVRCFYRDEDASHGSLADEMVIPKY